MPPGGLTHPDEPVPFSVRIEELLAEEATGPTPVVRRYRRADGEDLWMRSTVTLVREDDGWRRRGGRRNGRLQAGGQADRVEERSVPNANAGGAFVEWAPLAKRLVVAAEVHSLPFICLLGVAPQRASDADRVRV